MSVQPKCANHRIDMHPLTNYAREGTSVIEVIRATPNYHMSTTSRLALPCCEVGVLHTAFSRFYLKHGPDVPLQNSGEVVLSMVVVVVVVPDDYASLGGCDEKRSDNE